MAKEFVQALTSTPTRNIFYEDVGFAFRGTRTPRSYAEYVRRVTEYASAYGMQATGIHLKVGAIDTPEEIKHTDASADQLAQCLDRLQPEVAIGVYQWSPFSAAVLEWKAKGNHQDTKFFMYLTPEFYGRKKEYMVKQDIRKYVDATLETAKTLEGRADFLVLLEPYGSGLFISPSTFQQYVLPVYQLVARGTSLPVIVHMPGRTRKILPFLEESDISGLQAIDNVDLATVLENTKVRPIGNVDEHLLLRGASIQTLDHDFKRCATTYGGPWIVHTDFWIPWNADPRKVRHLSDLVRRSNN